MARIRLSGDGYDAQIREPFKTRYSPIHHMVQNETRQVDVWKRSHVCATVVSIIDMYPHLARVVQDRRAGMLPNRQTLVGLLCLVGLNEQGLIGRALRESVRNSADVCLNRIYVTRCDRYIQAGQQSRALRDTYCLLIDQTTNHSATVKEPLRRTLHCPYSLQRDSYQHSINKTRTKNSLR